VQQIEKVLILDASKINCSQVQELRNARGMFFELPQESIALLLSKTTQNT